MCHDNWVKIAMADDSLVVDLLLRLHQAQHPPPPPSLNLQWSVRQRRSKCVPRHNKAETTRASPTTPLSWSATTSASGGGATLDSYEESSRPTKHLHTSRSKVANPIETALTKKSRRKKTLAELKEEETLLLKERRSLKNELASLRLTLEKHRATNESLKRLKLDLESQRNSEPTKICEEFKKGVVDLPQCHPSTSLSPKTVTHKVIDGHSYVCPLNSCSKSQEMSKKESTLVLPDLNLPVDVDLSSNCMD
ncbi:uncharacterized protein LOC130940736 [Arachis stenosperma]|uniref:uncharacterized protein LOC130940736 n=1 Tax=Arachis stenosperma TaxID=217475 RepID=UPI0025AB71F0|nr:uncharacterized protein LOC130940736 [Arachis stenosperma]